MKAVALAVLAAATIVVVVFSLQTGPPSASHPSDGSSTTHDRDIDLSDFRLVFADEFQTLSLSTVSPKRSSTWYLYPPYGAAGSYSESQWHESTLSVSRGTLSSAVLKVPGVQVGLPNQKVWRTGNLSSVDETGAGFALRYGYFEAKMKMPASGTGSWPAFWLLSTNAIPAIGGTGSPYAEVDVLEWYGVNFTADPQRAIVSQASHSYTTYNKRSSDTTSSLYKPETEMPDGSMPWRAFHIYGVDVEPDVITWYIDGKKTNQIRNPTMFTTQPFFIMLDYALGGGYGLGGVVPGSELQVEWVRAYERK